LLVGGGEVLKKRTFLGIIILLVGLAVLAYGAYHVLTVKYVEANMHEIVGKGFVPIAIGVVLIIDGVVVRGFRNYYALVIHLIANIPYALAIIGINNLGQQTTPSTNPRDYVMATLIYWIIGVAFNIGGILANRFTRK
jgi:hypothetical protein